MIRRLGSLAGKRVVLGYDRYLLPDIEAYRAVLRARCGELTEAVDLETLHYLTSAERVCRAIQADEESFGVLACGTGMGMSIAANKFRGIYAARCTTVEDAELARTINNANVVCLATRSGAILNRAILEAFVGTPYTGRKLDELAHITELESPLPAARVGVAVSAQARLRAVPAGLAPRARARRLA